MEQLTGLKAVFDSPIGKLGVRTSNDFIVSIHFLSQETKTVKPVNALAKEAVQQLAAYFKGDIRTFALPINLEVSSFQKTVLDELCAIPFGETVSYGELATRLRTGPRAVGNACRRNPVPIIIPCHRVLARNNIGGFSGARSGQLINMKSWLLEHEKNTNRSR